MHRGLGSSGGLAESARRSRVIVCRRTDTPTKHLRANQSSNSGNLRQGALDLAAGPPPVRSPIEATCSITAEPPALRRPFGTLRHLKVAHLHVPNRRS